MKIENRNGGKVIGYKRVSTFNQKTDRQLEGIEVDRMFEDHISGSTKERPGLDHLMKYIREGDLIVVHSIDRFARNLNHLLELVNELMKWGIEIRFIKENLILDGHNMPTTRLILSIMGAFSEFERNIIRERQMEGIAIAKKKGHFKGRVPTLTRDQIDILVKKYKAGEAVVDIAFYFGMCRRTIYAYLKREKVYKRRRRESK